MATSTVGKKALKNLVFVFATIPRAKRGYLWLADLYPLSMLYVGYQIQKEIGFVNQEKHTRLHFFF